MKTLRMIALLAMCLVTLAGLPQLATAQHGSSEAARDCQQGGYAALVGAGGETFSNAGECVSFAARGGVFASGIVIPAGQTATFVNPTLSACNALAYGYTTSGGASGQLGGKPVGCATTTLASQTVGPFSTAVILTVYLQDLTCGQTYGSDGNHARVTGSSPVFQVDIADAGPGCSVAGVPVDLSDGRPGNLSVQVAINP